MWSENRWGFGRNRAKKAGGEVVGFLYLIKQNNFDFNLDKPLYTVIEYDD